MKPLLAHIFEPKRIDWGTTDVWLQPKLNGIRALYQDGNFQSRDELPWNKEVLRHLWQPLKLMFGPEIILDGELYVHGWKLQDINAAIAVNRGQPTEKTSLVEYHIFDRVSYNLPFEERFWNVMKYKNLFTEDIKIRLVDSIKTNDPQMADDYYALQVSKGYEGIMYRIGECPYTHPKEKLRKLDFSERNKFLSDKNNRTWHLLKRKDWHDDEFDCIGIEEGKGKRTGMVGRFVCLTNDLRRPFGVGSGVTDVEAIHYFENQSDAIGHKIKVKYLTFTSDGIPFNPTILAVL